MSKIQLSSNFKKHTSKNPIQKLLIKNFYNTLVDLARSLNPESILDAGCGEGFSLNKLASEGIGKKLEGVDDSRTALATGKKLFPSLVLRYGNIYNLPYKDNSFDLVACTEVLEHLNDPIKGLSEVLRVTRKNAIISVPHEPFFMLSNLLRGRNILQLGNHPDHINHWSVFSFKEFIGKEKVKIRMIKFPFPWIMIAVEK